MEFTLRKSAKYERNYHGTIDTKYDAAYNADKRAMDRICMLHKAEGVILMYPIIDKEKTGLKLKSMLKTAGYDVKFVQEYLHLSCPQPIYRWFQGKILPSIENLYALSRLLGRHMEELLVLQGQAVGDRVNGSADDMRSKRLLVYVRYIKKIA